MPSVVASAPGRVNLIGEHTDYNGGLVLPVAIPQRTTVTLSRRDDDRVVVASDVGGAVREYRLGREAPTGDWIDYVQGCTRMLAPYGCIGGAELAITSTVPVGAGLSSSAALEVAVLRAFRAAFGLVLDDVALARVAHRAEHDFVGARVGVMDQMAASLADVRTALFLDAHTMAFERVPLPPSLGLVVVDSGIVHRNVGGGYQARRAECDQACRLLGVPVLRALGDDALAQAAALPPPLDRRVRHVVTENDRVRDAVAALRAGALVRLGELFTASHASMRHDYEVSLPAIDALVARAAAQPGVFGARLTGGGFGGSIVVAAEAHAADAVVAAMTRAGGARAWSLAHGVS